ncbi:hypothetical protein E7T09_20465 [Deinococcus sp. KSM4-11]|uniref:hypothetical protein n=1 Tax=Deinococcus sp. KSM4-11 TaxID=2568654 RepID=UPI0010A32898|nr:hypothetical protein [Deinococcus sp. KSM4-11]THF84379.1 hypothetical protein E7T09_20465 [Deinococcus sp. KSM4-11]
MTESPEGEGPRALNPAAERHAAVSARHHVGAAGFAQAEALEQIISAGREQIALTQSLRQVVITTQTQLRDAADKFDTEQAEFHAGKLQEVVRSGHAQIEAADHLRLAIQSTLTSVRGTPLEDISAGLLTTLGTLVQQQAKSLEHLIVTAISETTNAEQIRKLQLVSADAALRSEAVEHERTERELVNLEHLQTQTLTRIRQLEADGQSHADQKGQLEDAAESSQRTIEVLEAAEVRDLAQIADLEAQEQGAGERRAELEGAAATNQERIEELGGVPAGQTSVKRDPQEDA